MDAEILEVAPGADARLEGQRPRNTPKLTFNLWSTYALGGGWKIGGGVEAKSDRYAYVPTAANANSNFIDGKFAQHRARLCALGRDAGLRAEELGRAPQREEHLRPGVLRRRL